MPVKYFLIFGVTVLLGGCQTIQQSESSTEVVDAPDPRIHIFIESGNSQPGDITLVNKDVSLYKAIKHALPNATILPDAGIDMDHGISLWVETASLAQYLTQVGRAANVSIEHSDGVVTVSPISRWNFTLPSEYADQARALSESEPGATVTILESTDDFVTLLVSAKPSQMVQLRTAIYQLSDQATLDQTFSELDAAKGAP